MLPIRDGTCKHVITCVCLMLYGFTGTFVGYIYVFAKMVKQCHVYMQGGKMYEMIIHRKSDSLISYLLQSTLSGTINLEFVLPVRKQGGVITPITINPQCQEKWKMSGLHLL